MTVYMVTAEIPNRETVYGVSISVVGIFSTIEKARTAKTDFTNGIMSTMGKIRPKNHGTFCEIVPMEIDVLKEEIISYVCL